MRLPKTFLVVGLFIISGAVLTHGCNKSPVTQTPPEKAFVVPPGFPQPRQVWGSGPLTEEGFVLGRKLFFDGRLSKDGNFPCSSCHQPVAGFTTYEHDRSHGFNNSHTLRNAPGLHNLAWAPEFNQDGSGRTLEEVARAHITHPQEMAETIPGVLAKLRADTAYGRLFKAAYGTEGINEQRLLNALAQYVLNLVSANAKYDRVRRGEDRFSAQEAAGYAVFQAKCTSCHTEPLFTDFSYRNIGLEVDHHLEDYGRMRVTGDPGDSLRFRVASLRNLAVTAHYMHDGRLSMFPVAVEHYRTGVIASPTLDPQLTGGLQMTDSEAFNLVQFLYTLTDSTFLNNSRYRE